MNHRGDDRGSTDAARLWALFGWTGVLFLVVAASDVVLTWVPTDFGNQEWEFGTITASFNGLLSVTFGLVMILAWMYHRARPLPLAVMAWLFGAAGLIVLAATALYWLNVPIALGSVPDGPVRVGLIKAVMKTGLQGVVFPIAYFLLARAAFRWSKSMARRQRRESA